MFEEIQQSLRIQNRQKEWMLLLLAYLSAEKLKTSNGNIFVMFMPPTVIPFIQPMDQDVLRLTKLYHYRNLLLVPIFTEDEPVGYALNELILSNAIIN